MIKNSFQETLLNWYDNNKRVLPWRDNNHSYRVWVSEIMLQQTKVSTVIPYFNRFVEAIPDVQTLASIEEDSLLKLWEGLGYYNRVLNMKKAAQIIVEKHNRVLPTIQEELEALPGIGRYTSGAILSISHNQQYTAVDGNVLRVFARLNAIETDIKDKKVKDSIIKQVKNLIPRRAGDFNQALMEVGATICLPNGNPLCIKCPLSDYCKALKTNKTSTIPIKQTKNKKKIEKRTVFLIEYNNQYVIEKRTEETLLKNMYQFPNQLGHLTKREVEKQYNNIQSIKKLPKSKHIFSHKVWDMIGYKIKLEDQQDYTFTDIQDIQQKYSIPTAFKTYKELI